jgi:hypothetical protein
MNKHVWVCKLCHSVVRMQGFNPHRFPREDELPTLQPLD